MSARRRKKPLSLARYRDFELLLAVVEAALRELAGPDGVGNYASVRHVDRLSDFAQRMRLLKLELWDDALDERTRASGPRRVHDELAQEIIKALLVP